MASDPSGGKGKKRTFERNVLYRSTLTGQFYFAPKVEVLGPTQRLVIGRKFDVTDTLRPYVKAKFLPKVKSNG
jgi:hypothetical protein